jgi:hypothetical protein
MHLTTQLSQIEPESALNIIFASSARDVILRVFLLDPHRAYYQRQLEAATGQPLRAIQRELDRLTSAGLLYRHTEGNRAYHRVDSDFYLYPELRSMVLKTAEPEDRLRGLLACEESVRLAFLCEEESRALVVSNDGEQPTSELPERFSVEVISMEEFRRRLAEDRALLEPFLVRGVDLLGRRDDVLWRWIDAAGYTVKKKRGVP